jgi:hypothetical protein
VREGQDSAGHPSRTRVSVQEAAEHLGTTVDAIRKRVQRETIAHEKDADGRVWILLDTDRTRHANARDTAGRRQDDGGALVKELRDRVAFLEEQLRVRDEEMRRRGDEAANYQQMIVGLTQLNTNLVEGWRQLEGRPEQEAPAEAGVDEDEGLDPDDAEPPRWGPPDVNRYGRPRATMFTRVVPLPRQYERVPPNRVTRAFLEANPPQPDLSTGALIYHERWQESNLSLLWHYGLGIGLIAGATLLDNWDVVNFGIVTEYLTLRFLVAWFFGIYIGMKDGSTTTWRRFHIIGVLAGIAASIAYLDVQILSGNEVLAHNNFLDAAADIGKVVLSYVIGTWLTFVSGVLLGMVVQYRAEQERWEAPGSSISRGGEGVAGERPSRAPTILAFLGVVVGALLQGSAQIIAALVGNG